MKQVPLRTPTKPIYAELNILPVPCIYILETVSFIHKNHMSFEKNSNFHNYNTRSNELIHLKSHRTAKRLQSLTHQGFNLYNKLPSVIKHQQYKKFKLSVKNILRKHLFYDVNDYMKCHF
jgi:hypothetical protein